MRTPLYKIPEAHKWLFWLYLTVIILLTVIPTGTADSGSFFSRNPNLDVRRDYLLHILIYLPMPFLMKNNLKISIRDISRYRGKLLTGVVFISLFLAVGLEFFQMLLDYRTFNVNDLAGNAGGVILGSLGVWIGGKAKKAKDTTRS